MVYFYRDVSPRRRSPRRTTMVLRSLMRNRLKKPPQSMSHHQHQKLPSPLHTPQSLISPEPLSFHLLKCSVMNSSKPSLSETSKSFKPLKTTSPHFTMTLLREDMLEFSSVLPPNKRLSTQSMRILHTFRDFTMPLIHSSNSPRTQELVRER